MAPGNRHFYIAAELDSDGVDLVSGRCPLASAAIIGLCLHAAAPLVKALSLFCRRPGVTGNDPITFYGEADWRKVTLLYVNQ